MKVKIAIVILILVCLGLGVALITEQRHRADEKKKSDDIIADQTSRLQDTSKKLEDQKVVNMTLEGDLKTRAAELGSLSNTLGKVIADLEKSDAQSKATAEQLRTAQAELAKKDQKINELETERTLLGKQMDQLTNSIFDLEKLIASTEKKLATEKGEKDFLVKELARLRAEKAELERKERELIGSINKKVEKQSERMKKLGLGKPQPVERADLLIPPLVPRIESK